MKKIFMLVSLILVILLNFDTVKADEIVRKVSITCGTLTQELVNNNDWARFNTRDNQCIVNVDLADGYNVITENYQSIILNEGDNNYKLTVRDTYGNDKQYNYVIKYESYGSSSNNNANNNVENPSTGDKTMFLMISTITILVISGISLNRYKKYSNEQ